ncbi:PstS family phosphate ABC transporter substrate-binding protein [Synechococcus elongatus IITB7]|uniref:PstS family phosphate ABC transporter substrate-binding protein n=1 Tax=Synechococcus elongatus TaxID=32046 RepID=UPI0030CA7BDC
MVSHKFRLLSLAALAVLATTACSSGEQQSSAGGGAALSGDVKVDGSSTVFPIGEAMAEEFQKSNSNVRVTVGVSGTGGGFKKFCAGETDISQASRPIKSSEMELCEKNGVEYVELPVAYDAVSVVVNNANDFATCLTTDQLKTAWEEAAEGKVSNWNQVDSSFPNKPLALYGPGTDSGTYDYFKEAIIGEGGTRGDFTASEDDNIVVQGVERNEGAMGFFGLAYLEENVGKLKPVAVKNSKGDCVNPSVETARDGSYEPLSRPLFIYVAKSALEKPQVKAFAEYLVNPDNGKLVAEAGYIQLPDVLLPKVVERLNNQVVGTVFGGGSDVGVNLAEKL